MAEALLEVQDLEVTFPLRSRVLRRTYGEVQAVSGVSFAVAEGETLGIVGESGCGKSTLARSIVGLTRPKAGRVMFAGTDLARLSRRRMLPLRREIQMVFQDPYASLNPRRTARQLISEPWLIHRGMVERRAMRAEADRLLELVGIDPGQGDSYPHQFSGGQRQRLSIARALALRPRLVVCDEPVSALDMSIQAQILNLLEDLQQELGLALVFIGHDLSVVRHIAQRVAVMYLGKLVETGPVEAVFERPGHPYTQALLAAAPERDPEAARRPRSIVLGGEVPSPADPPSGCRFRTRCWKAEAICAEQEPALEPRGLDHPVACHFAEATTVARRGSADHLTVA